MSKVKKALAGHKILFAAVLALTIFGAVYGFAATLSVSSNNLSAGNSSVVSCQATPVTATYTTSYDSTLPGYKVATVVVTGFTAACGTKTATATLTDGSNVALGGGTMSGTVPAAGGSVTFTPASSANAANVSNVLVAVNG